MALSTQELARRIRSARESAGLTQAAVAEALGVSRPTVGEIEAGRRTVSSIELEKFAYIVGRDIADFVADEFREDDVLAALFRADGDTADRADVLHRLRHCLALSRELQNLEQLADIERVTVGIAAYSPPVPRTRWDAIQQGERAADEERQRLGLGKAPAGDLAAMLDTESVRAAYVALPDDISGLTIAPDAESPFVAVNRDHPHNRQRFSLAHEYCHVLLDRDTRGRVSRTTDREDLREIRANAFAAAFLMPGAGVLDAVAHLGKGRQSRQPAAVFDEADVVTTEARAEPGSQDIQYYDVVQLAARFEVSPLAMLFRLKNLKVITEPELERLRAECDAQREADLERLMRMQPARPDPLKFDTPAAAFANRFIGLALEVFRRGKITLTKLRELASLIDINSADFERLLDSAGLTGHAFGGEA